LECDPVSAFGGVIGVNRVIDAAAAEEMAKLFVEAIAAPGFEPAALERFAAKKNLRLLEVEHVPQKWVLKNVSGGILLQDNDMRSLEPKDLRIVTKRQPTVEEMRALLFAWKVAKHVKSNAIVYSRDGQSVGVGAGQMSRRDESRFADARHGCCLRRVFSLSGWGRRNCESWLDGDHPAWRFVARRGSY
jgi:phosphoribosylaminoimidazolecarboxamide formyltransferase/IMP cyclohydrolase